MLCMFMVKYTTKSHHTKIQRPLSNLSPQETCDKVENTFPQVLMSTLVHVSLGALGNRPKVFMN